MRDRPVPRLRPGSEAPRGRHLGGTSGPPARMALGMESHRRRRGSAGSGSSAMALDVNDVSGEF